MVKHLCIIGSGVTLLLLSLTSAAQGLQITIDGVLIQDRIVSDNAGLPAEVRRDLSGLPGEISFTNQPLAPGTPGIPINLVAGYKVSGTVEVDRAGDALTSNVVHRISLTDFLIERTAGAADHTFTIVFQENFLDPAAPIKGEEGFKGAFINNPGPGVIGGVNTGV
jgi:hypothetical protein